MIHDAIQNLKPYKAPRVDGLQNIVLQNCVENIIDYIYFIFQAILDFEEYPPCWLIILTIVLRKPGKATYDVAKAYCPIGLLEMLGKLFSTLVTNDLISSREVRTPSPHTVWQSSWTLHHRCDAFDCFKDQRCLEGRQSSLSALSRYPSHLSKYSKRATTAQFEV